MLAVDQVARRGMTPRRYFGSNWLHFSCTATRRRTWSRLGRRRRRRFGRLTSPLWSPPGPPASSRSAYPLLDLRRSREPVLFVALDDPEPTEPLRRSRRPPGEGAGPAELRGSAGPVCP